MYKRLGGSQEQIDALHDGDRGNLFDPPEEAAIRFAEAMTRDAHSVDDEMWHELSSHYDDGEIIELASVIGLFNYFNRWNEALQTEITR